MKAAIKVILTIKAVKTHDDAVAPILSVSASGHRLGLGTSPRRPSRTCLAPYVEEVTLAPAGELCWSSRCETTDSDTQGGAVWRGHSRCWETERRKGPTRSVLTQTDGRRRSDSMRVGHASEIQTETLRLTFSSSDPHARACSRGRSG